MSDFICNDHPTYSGKRLTKRKCEGCIKKYMLENNVTIAEILSNDSINAENREWLKNSSLVSKASLSVDFGLISRQVAEDFDREVSEVQSVRGQKV